MNPYSWSLSLSALALAAPAVAQDVCLDEKDTQVVIGLDVKPMVEYTGYPTLVVETERKTALYTWIDSKNASAVVIEVGEKSEIVNIDVSPGWLENNINPIDLVAGNVPH